MCNRLVDIWCWSLIESTLSLFSNLFQLLDRTCFKTFDIFKIVSYDPKLKLKTQLSQTSSCCIGPDQSGALAHSIPSRDAKLMQNGQYQFRTLRHKNRNRTKASGIFLRPDVFYKVYTEWSSWPLSYLFILWHSII